MVSSDVLFKRLISINTLISFDGVIPSFSAFQLKMVRLIRQLQKSLNKEGATDADVQQLCWLIAIWLDRQISTNLDDNLYSWKAYSLEYALYHQKSENGRFAELLTYLLSAARQPLARYALQVGQFYSALVPHDQAASAALANAPLQPSRRRAAIKPEEKPTCPQASLSPQQSDKKSVRPGKPVAETIGLVISLAALWMLSLYYMESLL